GRLVFAHFRFGELAGFLHLFPAEPPTERAGAIIGRGRGLAFERRGRVLRWGSRPGRRRSRWRWPRRGRLGRGGPSGPSGPAGGARTVAIRGHRPPRAGSCQWPGRLGGEDMPVDQDPDPTLVHVLVAGLGEGLVPVMAPAQAHEVPLERQATLLGIRVVEGDDMVHVALFCGHRAARVSTGPVARADPPREFG